MLCLKKLIIGSGIFLPVLLSLLFVSPSYAIDDLIISCPNRYDVYCYICAPSSYDIPDIPTCSDLNNYSFAIFDFPNKSWLNSNTYLYNANFSSIYPYNFSSIIYNFSSDFSSFNDIMFNPTNVVSNPATYTITLTDSIGGSCSQPDDPEPCPVVPDTPYGDQLNNITMAIYTCGGILLVLYFFYCIYRIIIKNSGVSNL